MSKRNLDRFRFAIVTRTRGDGRGKFIFTRLFPLDTISFRDLFFFSSSVQCQPWHFPATLTSVLCQLAGLSYNNDGAAPSRQSPSANEQTPARNGLVDRKLRGSCNVRSASFVFFTQRRLRFFEENGVKLYFIGKPPRARARASIVSAQNSIRR